MWKQWYSCEEGNWKLNDEFRALQVDNPPDLQTKMDDKVNRIFRIMNACPIKHFDPWCNKSLSFFLFSESDTAWIVARYINDNYLLQYIPPTHISKDQGGKTIDISEFGTFVRNRCTSINDIQSTQLIRTNLQSISLIKQGMDIWVNENIPEILRFFSSFPTNNHNIERTVKKTNHCSLTKRGKSTRPIYTITNSCVIQESNVISRRLESKKKKKLLRHCKE